jgi:rubrerythrin
VNLTGIATAEARAEEMQRGMDRFPPTSRGSTAGAAMVRVAYARERHPVGTPPLAAGGDLDDSPFLADKLGERLAFERTGTRLYEALLSKLEAFPPIGWGPSRDDLVEILEDEHRHFMMLSSITKERGGDPTAMTLSAAIAGVMSEGIQKVLTDARTTLAQCLEAILVAELADHDGWETLIELAQNAGEDRLVEAFEEAERTEERHLERVRGWLRAGRTATAACADPEEDSSGDGDGAARGDGGRR